MNDGPVELDLQHELASQVEVSNVSELSPTIRGLLDEPRITDLLRPLGELAPWKEAHSIDVARITEQVYGVLDKIGLPHVPVEIALEAALLHDIGIANNPHTAHEPDMVNSSRKYNEEDRRRFGTHPGVGAARVDDPTI